MFREKAKERLVKQIATESGAIEAITDIVAGLEQELLGEIDALHEAQGIEYYDELPDQDERSEALQNLIMAQFTGDPKEYYIENELSRHIENPDDAKGYLGIDADEWEDQKQRWADAYQDKVDGAERMTTDELAAVHVNQMFGVSLGEFHRRVIEWSASEMLEAAVAGNMRRATAGIRHSREALEAEGEETEG